LWFIAGGGCTAGLLTGFELVTCRPFSEAEGREEEEDDDLVVAVTVAVMVVVAVEVAAALYFSNAVPIMLCADSGLNSDMPPPKPPPPRASSRASDLFTSSSNSPIEDLVEDLLCRPIVCSPIVV
jgi:hypothetical protein